MLFSWAIPVYAAGEICPVQYDVTYGQTEARTMLAMINDFRTGGDAWYWAENDADKIQATGLQPLIYDYELEKVAMQRAAEIAINFAHDRPDGTKWGTAYDDVGSNFGYTRAENIAVGSSTAKSAFTMWQETGEPYAGQGHRRNMLSSSSQTFAVGHVVYEGIHFWVQEFGGNLANGTETPANDDVTTATVNVSADQVTQKTVQAPAPITLEQDQGTELPLVDVTMTLKDTAKGFWDLIPQVKAQASWQDDSKGIVKVEGNQVTALKAGTTTLTGTVLGEAVSLDVTVNAASLKGADVTLNQTQFTVTGSEIRPAVTVTLNGKTLVENADYTVSYADNVEIGTATVTVQGIGNYTDTLQTTFEIVPCNHQWDAGVVTKEPTCTAEGEKTYTCTLCNDTKTEAIPAREHQWGEGVVTKEPTCAAEGEKTYTCTLCKTTKTEPIAKTEHTPVTIAGTPATCTTPGMTEGSECSVCGTILTAQEEIPALGHDFGEWHTVNTASCTASGSEERVCERCNYTETRNLDPTGHTWNSEPTVDKEPTCTEDGSQSIHCANCDATKDPQVIPALGHSWDEGVVTTPATCTEAGEKTYTCSNCHETKTEPIPATGHAWDEGVVTTPATCTEAGEKTYTCSNCHETRTEPVPATGHAWDEGVVTTPATCTEAGEMTYTCSRCENTKTETISATGHNAVTIPGKAATCTETGLTDGTKCSVCGTILEQQTEIAALGHAWDEGVVTTEATCTEDGAILYTCQRCSETMTETIPATGHSYEESWSSDGTNHWHACQVCGDRSEEAAHSWTWIVDQEPNGTKPGKQHQECTVCGDRGQEQTILTATVPGGETGKEYRVHVVDSQPAETVEDTLTQAAATKLPTNAVNSKTAFYEVELQHRESGGEWQNADAAGMQITVTLPYPAGTNGTDHDFIVTHLMENGKVEHPAAVETVDGLLVTFQGLSPVSVTAYQQKASDPVTTPDETENDPDDDSEQTQNNNQSGSATPVPATPTPAPAPSENSATAPAAAPTAAPQSAIPATADSFPLALWVVLFAAGTCGLIALVVTSRRRDG